MTNLLRSDFLMQLGAYMERAGWRETARVYLQHAATLVTSDNDYEIVYSVGEYFHNIEEDVDLAAGYFKEAAVRCFNVVQGKGKAGRDKVREHCF